MVLHSPHIVRKAFMTWRVQLGGSAESLRRLAAKLRSGRLVIRAFDDKYYLESPVLDDENFSEFDAYAAVLPLIQQSNGILKLESWANDTVQGVAVERVQDDGLVERFPWPGNRVSYGKLLAQAAFGFGDRVIIEFDEPTWEERVVVIATGDEDVADVVALYATATRDWAELYVIFEIVQSSVGGSMFDASGFLGLMLIALRRRPIVDRRLVA
jgi:hypothetical protein